jgi:MFS family permease
MAVEEIQPPDERAIAPRGRLAGRPAAPLAVLALVNLVDQVDVNILRGVLPFIEDEFDTSDLQLGALGFAFVFINALATIPAGWVADRVRRNRLIGFTLLSWSGLSALAASAGSYLHLFLARASLGFGQAIDDPASTSLLADYYPASVRGRVFSIQQVMNFVGTGLGLALGAWVAEAWGWRWAFVVVGMPGSLVAFLAFRLREPARGEADGHAVHDEPPPSTSVRELATTAWQGLRDDLRMIFGIRTMRFVLVGVSTLLFTVAGVGYWLAVYHDRYSDLTETEAAGAAALVLATAGIIGTLFGGRLTDRVYGVSPAGRITLVSNAILICAVLFLISFAMPILPVRFLLQFVGVLSIASAFPGLRAAMMDVTPVHARGVSTSAFALTSTLFGTALAPPFVGLLSDATGSLVAAFYLVTPPVVIGSLILRRAKHTIVDDAAAIVATLADRAAAVPAGERDDGPELGL